MKIVVTTHHKNTYNVPDGTTMDEAKALIQSRAPDKHEVLDAKIELFNEGGTPLASHSIRTGMPKEHTR